MTTPTPDTVALLLDRTAFDRAREALPRDLAETLDAAVENAEDLSDLAAIGDAERLPAEMVERMIAGEHPLRAWRRHRNMTLKTLAEAVGVTPAYLGHVETRRRDGPVALYRKLAEALCVTVDDLIP